MVLLPPSGPRVFGTFRSIAIVARHPRGIETVAHEPDEKHQHDRYDGAARDYYSQDDAQHVRCVVSVAVTFSPRLFWRGHLGAI